MNTNLPTDLNDFSISIISIKASPIIFQREKVTSLSQDRPIQPIDYIKCNSHCSLYMSLCRTLYTYTYPFCGIHFVKQGITCLLLFGNVQQSVCGTIKGPDKYTCLGSSFSKQALC